MIGNNPSEHEKTVSRWQQIKQLGVFQIKLALDAVRDLLLSPLSILLSLMDIIEGKQGDDSYFNRLMVFGRRTDKSIDLFNHYGRRRTNKQSVDGLVEQIESIVANEVASGELSVKTKRAIEKTVKAVKFKSAKDTESPSKSTSE
ncbi:MAG: hypothetical protein V2I33_06755 [Kangiellaceae bacterium]|jgi:hypothetical protein|nr:hypothetical protein [Kangiellaceae bacterium]